MQILGSVHFEKCLPESFSAISATTSRMALRDSIINDRTPAQYCRLYLTELERLIERLENSFNVHLKEQPIFEWLVDGEPQFSPCWRFEHVMVLRCLSNSLIHDARERLRDGDFKGGKALFKEAKEVCEKARDGPVRKWTFKDMPTLLCSYKSFWDGEIDRCESYSHLSSFQFAIKTGHAENSKSHNILNIVCKKLLHATTNAVAHSPDVALMHDLAFLLKAYIHAQKLWSEGNYPDALAVADYESVSKPNIPEAHVLLQWMVEREELFQSWRHESANVHFVTKSQQMRQNT